MATNPLLLGRPIGVVWAGWQSDTYTLQRNGWNFALERDLLHQQYTLALEHKDMRLYALTDRISFEQAHFSKEYSPEVPLFRVVHVAQTIRIREVVTSYDWRESFKPIDATPQYRNDIYDMDVLFAPFRTKVEEVIINKADMTVIEHLEAIKRLQDPEQTAIRKRMLDEGHAAQKSVIIQLAEYRKV
jgi:hypothetical protein